ncbi:MAG: dTMP kinase, partial [Lentisphaeria bacterium]|nr:dTMP kinase [Lentisphaeria bacterium]
RTREPGGTPMAEELRKIVKSSCSGEIVHPETELLLMEAARSQHMRELILPALAAGKVVICDRFTDSTTAYQGGARGISGETVKGFNLFAAAGRLPDLTFLMDITPECGFKRIRNRFQDDGAFDRFEAENLEFHHRVRNAFLAIAAAEPERVRVIDADRPRECVQKEIEDLANEFVR